MNKERRDGRSKENAREWDGKHQLDEVKGESTRMILYDDDVN
jgi:hypothetical protein